METMNWTAIPAYILDQVFGYQSANKLRENLIVLASRRSGRSLGGSRLMPGEPAWDAEGLPTSNPAGLGPWNAVDYIDVEIDGTNQTGMTYQARVEVRTNQATMTITPKVRNVTDGTDAGTGSSCAAAYSDYSGTNQKQTIALTVATGVKKYRLQYTLGAIVVGGSVWCVGEVESFATA